MAKLGAARIADLAVAAGFSRTRQVPGTGLDEVTLFTAVALAESGGNTEAHNRSDPHGGSWGLWQINGAHATSWPSLWSRRTDPVANATLARNVFKAQGVRAWGAYTNGSYRTHLDVAAQASRRASGVAEQIGGLIPGVGTAIDVNEQSGRIADVAETLLDWRIWVRVAMVALGGVGLLVGLALIGLSTSIGEKASRAALRGATRGLVG